MRQVGERQLSPSKTCHSSVAGLFLFPFNMHTEKSPPVKTGGLEVKRDYARLVIDARTLVIRVFNKSHNDDLFGAIYRILTALITRILDGITVTTLLRRPAIDAEATVVGHRPRNFLVREAFRFRRFVFGRDLQVIV